MSEILKSIRDNLQISDIVAVISMIGAALAAILAWISKRKAAQSEAQAAQYAKNADEANQSAKRYYDEMHGHLVMQSEQLDRDEQKKRILVAMASGYPITALEIAENVGMAEDSVEAILKELKIELRVTSDDFKPRRWKIIGIDTAEDKLQKAISDIMKRSRDRSAK